MYQQQHSYSGLFLCVNTLNIYTRGISFQVTVACLSLVKADYAVVGV